MFFYLPGLLWLWRWGMPGYTFSATMVYMELLYVYYFAIFYLGAIMGSFLNVVALDIQKLFDENDLEHRNELFFFSKHIARHYFWESLLSRRSHCDHCERTLSSFELFPIFSMIWQRGRCRTCRSPIDLSNLWIEIICGVYFFGIFHTIFWNFEFLSGAFLSGILYLFAVFGVLFVLALFDYRTGIIPDILVLAAGALIAAHQILYNPAWLSHLAAGAVFALVFATLWFVSGGRLIGFADAKVALLVGLFFGFSAGLTALAVAFWVGALVAMALVGIGKIHKTEHSLALNSAIPFGPFLVCGMWYVFVSGLNLFQVVA